MTWLYRRPTAFAGRSRVNAILAFRWIAVQIRVDEFQGNDGWVIELIPTFALARSAWNHFGFEINFLVFSVCAFLPTAKFHKGIEEELVLIAKWDADPTMADWRTRQRDRLRNKRKSA
jgi:hypothetical protein